MILFQDPIDLIHLGLEGRYNVVGVCGRAEPLPHSHDTKERKVGVLEPHNSHQGHIHSDIQIFH